MSRSIDIVSRKSILSMIERVLTEPCEIIPGAEDGQIFKSWYLGKYFDLDPCGKYHSYMYENGMSKQCRNYWLYMEEACVELGVSLETGEDDLTDVYILKEEEYLFCLPSELAHVSIGR